MKTLLHLIRQQLLRRLVRLLHPAAQWQPALVRPAAPRPQSRSRSGFTLIELLVVIAIIGILAAMLFPAIMKAKTAAQVGTAKTDMQNLAVAIKTYESDYNGRLPAPGIPTGAQDVTYGYVTNTTVAGQYAVANNRDVIAVLMNWEKFPDGTTTTNNGKVFNPRGLTPLNANMAKDTSSPGIGPDGNYRDPWGNQYVISMDSSLNERCRDNFYSRQLVSRDGTSGQKGLYGLSNPNAPGSSDEYELNGQFLIWSRGPDGQAAPNIKANIGVNRDNVLGWQ